MAPNRRGVRNRLAGWRRLMAACGAAGLPWLGQGCAGLSSPAETAAPPLVRAAEADAPKQAAPAAPEVIHPPRAEVVQEAPPKPVPINLDTVLRLTQGQNAKINVARAQVQEAFAEKCVADKKWLPDVYVGTSYYRHEGAIQREDGEVIDSSFGSLFGGMELNGQFDLREAVFQRVNAERKIWQQRGELSRVSSETLLDAANTYIDLLAAYQGEAIIHNTDRDINNLLRDAKNLAETERGLRIEVSRVQAEVANREQMATKFREQAAAAKAKLAYLLGVNPDCDLLPVDSRLAALSLVDARVPLNDLVAQALTNGPGVREMEGLLNLVQESMEKSKGMGQFVPVVGLRMAEGIFGGGPGARSDWDNRWDLGLQVRWNLTELASAHDRQCAARAKLNQLHFSYQDLRGRLTAGVQEARTATLRGREQLRQGEDQIQNAQDTLKQAQERLRDFPPERKSPSEVLLSIRSLMGAQLSYLGVLRDYDKAQLRLLVLLGQATPPAAGGPHCGG